MHEDRTPGAGNQPFDKCHQLGQGLVQRTVAGDRPHGSELEFFQCIIALAGGDIDASEQHRLVAKIGNEGQGAVEPLGRLFATRQAPFKDLQPGTGDLVEQRFEFQQGKGGFLPRLGILDDAGRQCVGIADTECRQRRIVGVEYFSTTMIKNEHRNAGLVKERLEITVGRAQGPGRSANLQRQIVDLAAQPSCPKPENHQ